MTSKEIVRRTLDFSGPERVACSFGKEDLIHIASTAETHGSLWKEIGGGKWECRDQWGNTWGRVDPTSKGEVIRGVLEDLSVMDTYEFPDYSKAKDYDGVRALCNQCPDQWIQGFMPGFTFNIARKMRRLDQYMMDLILEADRMHELHDRIDVMLEQMIRNFAAAGVDSIFFGEDWGTQNQMLISPTLWREEFFPRFEKLCGMAHDLGLKVFMHSCGKIGEIIPGLIEAGIDVLQFDQPDLHGIDELAAYQVNSKITFWCPVDIQKTLQQRNEAIIRDKAREMIDQLWKGRGGFIAGFYTDNASIGLEPMWQEMANDEFVRYGRPERGHHQIK